MMILNINTTSTTKTLTLCGTPIKLDGSTVLLRDFNTLSNYASKADFENDKPKERSWNYIKDSSGINRADENLYDIKLTSSKDGKTIDLFNRWHGRKTFKLTDTNEIETTIRLWNEEALGNSDRKFVAANSAIKGDLSSKVSRPAETSDSSSGDYTSNLFSKFGKTVDKNTTTVFPNLAEVFKLPDFRTKTVKHPSTFRGKTLTLGEKVQVNDLSRVFGSQDGKVYVELTEKGYIVSSPALDKQYRVNVNSPKSSQVIRQLEATVKKVETAVDNKIKPKAENVPQTLRVIGDYQDTSLAETPNYSGYLRGEPLWGSQQK
jgi:hypothetical protein